MVTLQNENIPDDKLDELLINAEADSMEARFDRDRNPRHDSEANQYEDELDDKMFNRMFKKIKAKQDAEDLMDEDYQEHKWITANEDMDYEDEYKSELDNEENKQMLDRLAAELVELGKPDKEVLFKFDVAFESEEEDGVACAGVRFADTNDKESDTKGIIRSYSDNGVEVGAKRVLCPRHNRSYFSQGVKMKPTERYRREKSRFGQAYLQRRNSPVPNVLRNRCGNTNKGKYDADKALVVARVIQRICEGVNGGINGQDGVSFIQQYYLNKGLKIFKERGKDVAMIELDQLIKRRCWTTISIEKLRPTERKKAIDAMMLLAKKNDGVTIKGHGNGCLVRTLQVPQLGMKLLSARV
ncbi:unnamed protein product [Cylindrotheca closterium]|uniref:Uncharacterized protein n=1 Tax=Cylindrotheca closterium TaxID=2856 RepID=A0AAD2FHM2_9STRA|nr:unnamed protein product [Cylindrotheca closterium]